MCRCQTQVKSPAQAPLGTSWLQKVRLETQVPLETQGQADRRVIKVFKVM